MNAMLANNRHEHPAYFFKSKLHARGLDFPSRRCHLQSSICRLANTMLVKFYFLPQLV